MTGKLVRNKIPDIIRAEGGIPHVISLPAAEYRAALDQKLKEEVEEYLDNHDVVELADIYEVLLAILKARDMTLEELTIIRVMKWGKNGGFDKDNYLVGVT